MECAISVFSCKYCILEEYMKDIQEKGGSSPSTGPVRQDEPVS